MKPTDLTAEQVCALRAMRGYVEGHSRAVTAQQERIDAIRQHWDEDERLHSYCVSLTLLFLDVHQPTKDLIDVLPALQGLPEQYDLPAARSMYKSIEASASLLDEEIRAVAADDGPLDLDGALDVMHVVDSLCTSLLAYSRVVVEAFVVEH